ncbi:MAG: metallophosphoesterase [Thiotrichales bacterium]|nr:metallophosphoesterase [Thiotrichales bacterium]
MNTQRLASNDFYSGNGLCWTPSQAVAFDQNTWQKPAEDTVFFCDLHADAHAFLRSLKASFLVSQTCTLEQPELTTQGQTTQIFIGGDCFDKGPSNLALLNLLNALRLQGAKLTLLAGNHDIRFYAGLLSLDFADNPRQSHFFTRMGRKTAALFAEIYQHYAQELPSEPTLSEAQIAAYLFPRQDWPDVFARVAKGLLSQRQIDKEIRTIQFKQTDFLSACQSHGLSTTQIYWAVQKARQLFVDPNGAYHWFFKELKLMTRSGSYLFCHAGLDDQVIQQLKHHGIDHLNQRFQQQLTQGNLFELYYNELGNVFRTKYRNTDKPLTQNGARSLKEIGIYAIVNGHRSHENGQQLFVRHGLLNFECDTQLNANCRQKRNIKTLGYSATIFYQSGLVKAISSDTAETKMFDPKRLRPLPAF